MKNVASNYNCRGPGYQQQQEQQQEQQQGQQQEK
jgi:hypothetical protein